MRLSHSLRVLLPVFLLAAGNLSCTRPGTTAAVFIARYAGVSATTEHTPATETPRLPQPLALTPPRPRSNQASPTPTSAVATSVAPAGVTLRPPLLYYTQAGDTLRAVAARFGVAPGEITSPAPLPAENLLDPGILLIIPARLGDTSSAQQLLPDSEVVFSPSALDFDLDQTVSASTGYLRTYTEWRSNGWMNGAQAIRQVAVDSSINPRLLLVLLEQQSHWVSGQPETLAQQAYPLGWMADGPGVQGLYFQLRWAAQQLNTGYYGWREGSLTELSFPDRQTKLRLAPSLNAGTVALLYLFAQLDNLPEWAGLLYGPDGIMQTYGRMVGNPWLRAEGVEPLFPATLAQPPLEFPFAPGTTWSFTGGPHGAWDRQDTRAALDFAPSGSQHGCYDSDAWITAMASGVVVRSGNGLVVEDLDGDGQEQTGWSILYLHVSTRDRVVVGRWLNQDDPIGHPSCEGGEATGIHVHVARKYNGEWILADDPLPFTLEGWVTHAGKELYQGWLTRGADTITSSLVGEYFLLVYRPKQ